MNPSLSVIVRDVREVAPGIKQFTFAPADGKPLPVFSGGSHIVVSLPVGNRTHRNPYSLMGNPDDRQAWRICVRKQEHSRGGSAFLHERVEVGMQLEVSDPVNLFSLSRRARRHILIAGGIGITPILAQARDLARLGADFEVHYACRAPEYAVYADTLMTLAPGKVTLYVQSQGSKLNFVSILSDCPLGTHVYICGPQGMIESCLSTGRALGWPASHLHSEQFLAPATGDAFDVLLAKSQKKIVVPSDLTLLEAIEQAGVDAPYLCRGGACGQCETEVLEADGAIDHHDIYLTAEERASGRKIMPCVSRFRGGCLALNI